MSKGFISSSYLNKVKPPYITGVLALIGAIITAFGFGMLFFTQEAQFLAIPYVCILLGTVLLLGSTTYFLGRRIGISSAKAQEEKLFRNWVTNHHGLVLNDEQTDQLYNYGTTIVNGETYFTQKDFTENGDTRIFIAKQEPTDLLETGAVILPDLTETPQETPSSTSKLSTENNV